MKTASAVWFLFVALDIGAVLDRCHSRITLEEWKEIGLSRKSAMGGNIGDRKIGTEPQKDLCLVETAHIRKRVNCGACVLLEITIQFGTADQKTVCDAIGIDLLEIMLRDVLQNVLNVKGRLANADRLGDGRQLHKLVQKECQQEAELIFILGIHRIDHISKKVGIFVF